MPFNAPLTAGQITQVRETLQRFEHYMLITPNDVVWQAEIDDSKANVVYGDFEWANTQAGASASVVEGQVVLITDSKTDFTQPILRGRVRKVPGATTFYINETGINIDNTLYLTVLDTFDVVERLARVISGVLFMDYDIPFQLLPPTLSGLQSAYADFTNDATVTLSFAPTATAQTTGATITTWLWDVGDGSITVGTSASQNITVDFPGAVTNDHRWVHLTVTDSNSISQAFHFQVFTVNKNSSSVVALDTGVIDINANIQDGWNGSFTTWANFSKTDILDLTRVVVAGISYYDTDTTPIVSNIMLIGQIRTELNTPTADEDNLFTETNITIEGFGSQLARIPFVTQQILDNDNPAKYGDIANPTPNKILTYILAYNSTILSLCSIEFETLTAYGMGDQNLGSTNVIQNILDITDVVKAIPMYAPSGEIAVYRNGNYVSTSDRNALDTIFDFTTQDYSSGFSLDIKYGQSIGQAVSAAIVYDTTNNKIDQVWEALAPSESFGGGYEQTTMGNQILTADSTQANARSEIGQRTANDLAFVNLKPILDITVMDGFWWATPTVYQWWTHTIPASLTVRERDYTSSDRWWLGTVSYIAIPEEETRETQLRFELETESTNAGILPSLLPDINETTFDYPPMGGFDFFIDDPLVNYSIDTPTLDVPFESDFSLEPYPDVINNTPTINQELLNVLMGVSKNVSTTRSSTASENYSIEVIGDGVIETGGGWTKTFDFTESEHGFTIVDSQSGAPNPSAAYVPGCCFSAISYGSSYFGAIGAVSIKLTGSATITEVAMYGNLNFEGTITDVGQVIAIDTIPEFSSGSATNLSLTVRNTDVNGELTSATGLSQAVTSSDYFILRWGATDYTTPFARMSSVTITGTGSCPFSDCAGSDEIRGDSFYDSYNIGTPTAYAGLNGLLIDGAKPSPLPIYDDGHRYTFNIAGTGSPFVFTYADTDFTDNANNIIKVIVNGPNMGVTA